MEMRNKEDTYFTSQSSSIIATRLQNLKAIKTENPPEKQYPQEGRFQSEVDGEENVQARVWQQKEFC